MSDLQDFKLAYREDFKVLFFAVFIAGTILIKLTSPSKSSYLFFYLILVTSYSILFYLKIKIKAKYLNGKIIVSSYNKVEEIETSSILEIKKSTDMRFNFSNKMDCRYAIIFKEHYFFGRKIVAVFKKDVGDFTSDDPEIINLLSSRIRE